MLSKIVSRGTDKAYRKNCPGKPVSSTRFYTEVFRIRTRRANHSAATFGECEEGKRIILKRILVTWVERAGSGWN
jgi:hypothetical protein